MVHFDWHTYVLFLFIKIRHEGSLKISKCIYQFISKSPKYGNKSQKEKIWMQYD